MRIHYPLAVQVRVGQLGGALCHVDEKGVLTVSEPLPSHPHPRHSGASGATTSILPSFGAGLVLEQMRLPRDADPNLVYVASAMSSESNEAFVHAVWYTPKAADALSERPGGAHESTTATLHET